MKKHLVVILTGALAGLMLYGFFTFNNDLAATENKTSELILSGFGGVVLAYGIRKINELLDQILPWRTNVGLRMLLGIVGISLVAFSFLWFGINVYTSLTANGWITFKSHFSPLTKLAILSTIATIIYQVVYFALHSYHVYTMLQVEEIKTERRQVEYQLQALKSQLSPHFLFNNLNAISALAYLDPKNAESFTRKMASLYSNILKQYGNQLIPLKDELSNLQAYAYLLNARFGESLQTHIEIKDEFLTSSIPPLSLQLLVENAVKHNSITEELPLIIRVYDDKDWLIVSNNKTTSKAKKISHKVGLKNITRRYQLIAGKHIKVIENESFTVQLPIIR